MLNTAHNSDYLWSLITLPSKMQLIPFFDRTNPIETSNPSSLSQLNFSLFTFYISLVFIFTASSLFLFFSVCFYFDSIVRGRIVTFFLLIVLVVSHLSDVWIHFEDVNESNYGQRKQYVLIKMMFFDSFRWKLFSCNSRSLICSILLNLNVHKHIRSKYTFPSYFISIIQINKS